MAEPDRASRPIRFLLGALLTLFGAVAVFLGVVAFIDPAATQLANDDDPFGTPPSRLTIAVQTALHAMVLASGVVLLSGRRPRSTS